MGGVSGDGPANHSSAASMHHRRKIDGLSPASSAHAVTHAPWISANRQLPRTIPPPPGLVLRLRVLIVALAVTMCVHVAIIIYAAQDKDFGSMFLDILSSSMKGSVNRPSFVKEVNLSLPVSETEYPFFTGIYHKDQFSAHETRRRLMMRAMMRNTSMNGTNAVTDANATQVLLVLVVRPGDNVDDAIGALDFLLGSIQHNGLVGHLGNFSTGHLNQRRHASISYQMAMLVPQTPHSLHQQWVNSSYVNSSYDYSSVEFRRKLEASGQRWRRAISLLKAPLPYSAMKEALAIMAFYAYETSHFLLPLRAGTRPIPTTSEKDDFAILFSQSIESIASKYMDHRGNIRLAYANFLDGSSLTDEYEEFDGIGGRLFHSHYAMSIGLLMIYFGDTTPSRILGAIDRVYPENGLILESVKVDAAGLFQVPRSSCKSFACNDGSHVVSSDTKKNVMEQLLLPRRAVSTRQELVFCFVTVPRKATSKPYVLEMLRSLLREIDAYKKSTFMKGTRTNQTDISIVLQIAGASKFAIASHRKVIEDEFADEIKEDGGIIRLIDAPLHLYPPLSNLRRNFNDTEERVIWRSKQNLDYSALYQTMSTVNTKYFIMLEDDVSFKNGFIGKVMHNVEATDKSKPWTYIDFAVKIGFAGKVFRGEHAAHLGLLTRLFYDEQPCDWLVFYLCELDGKNWRTGTGWKSSNHVVTTPDLLTHMGTVSSFHGKNVADEKESNHAVIAKRSLESFNYVGCLKDQSKPRDLPHMAFAFHEKARPFLCHQSCDAYDYFGMQMGQECWCGNNPGTLEGLGRADNETECNVTCHGSQHGSQREICGGPFRNSVWKQVYKNSTKA